MRNPKGVSQKAKKAARAKKWGAVLRSGVICKSSLEVRRLSKTGRRNVIWSSNTKRPRRAARSKE